ncbi:MAG: hypothetical protein J6W06_03140 [Bacteroidales bacterium]|nr:hypothetical protein [Bacteroidales bacterium]
MNAKKSLSLAIAAIMVILPIVFSSCGVGDGDPFLSFRSRKQRVCGTWTVTNFQSEVIRKVNNINTKTVTTVDGDSWKQVITIVGTDSTRTLIGKITKEPNQAEGSYFFTFDKNGKALMTYKYEYDEDLSGEDDDVSTVRQTKVTEEMTGTWNFLGGIDEYKDKERLAFVIEDKKTTTYEYELITSDDDEGGVSLPRLIGTNVVNDRYANGEMCTVYAIIELRNKEIKLHQNINTFYLRNDNGTGESYQDNGYEELILKPRQ